MNIKWKNLSIQTKIMVIGGCISISFIATIFFYLVPAVELAIYDMKKEKIKDIVDTTAATIEGMYQEYLNNNMTKDELRENAIEYAKKIRYGPEAKDYVWINDFHPTMIMHPYRSEMNGQDLTDYKDPMGKRLFMDFVDTCRNGGAGYVRYIWQYKDEKSRLEPKISYVRSIPMLNGIVGTGVYEVDIKKEISARVRSLQINLAIVFAGVTAAGIILIFLVSRKIKKGIELCVDFARKLAEGNLQDRIDLKQSDEIGNLAGTLNVSVDDLENLVSNVILSSQNLAQAVEQIAGGNENLSQRTSEQATSLEEVASTIEEATATIKQNAENSLLAKKMAIDSSQIAEEGGKVVDEAVAAINDVSLFSKKIGDIISVINEIAFQTNLLALNAAVEAARAGEQGRGFAVVAGEVRNLAQRAGASAKEINQLIKDSMERIAASTELANKSGYALREIIQSVKSVAHLMAELSASNEEQKRGVSQINTAIAELDTMTQQNAALVEETASASEEMANLARELMTMMEKFKIRDEVWNEARRVSEEQARRNAAGGATHAPDKKDDGNGRKKIPASAGLKAKNRDVKETPAKEGFEEF